MSKVFNIYHLPYLIFKSYRFEETEDYVIDFISELSEEEVNITDTFKSTFLMKAARNNHIKIIKLLLEYKNINPNMKDSDRNTAFLIALYVRNFEAAKLIFEHPKTDINIKNKHGNTSLNLLTQEEDGIELFEYLINRNNINVNHKNYLEKSVLTHAIENNNYNHIILLLEHPDVDVNISDNNIYLEEAERKGYDNIVKLLEEFAQ